MLTPNAATPDEQEAAPTQLGDQVQLEQRRATLASRIILGLEATVGGARAERRLDIEKPRPDGAERSAAFRQAIAKYTPLINVAGDTVFEDAAMHCPEHVIAVDFELHVP